MMDEIFVKIVSCFNKEADRNISYLSSKYLDDEFIESKILDLTKEYLNPGSVFQKKVLIKPNWVRHNVSETDKYCLTTQESVILALVSILIKHRPSKITIGDAPIQGCNWSKLISVDFIQKIRDISHRQKVPIFIKDFRRVKFDVDANILEDSNNSLDNFIIFDLGERSFLEPITSSEKNNFRVTLYDPDRLKESHSPGVHKYCITKELFDADLVISIPKVKTHQKAGLTAALKNLVGLNGDKDFLPHHRIGGTGMGGDSYPGNNFLRYGAELLFDKSYKNIGRPTFKLWTRLAALLWKLSFPGQNHQTAAAWYGNDTTWRMVLDLNLIAVFGKGDGSIGETPQRVLYSLCDGIVGGQGDGPLKPEPLPLGILSFSNNSALNDLCMAELMQLKIEKIPLLFEAKSFIKNDINIELNNNKISKITNLENISIKTKLPPGWVGYDINK
jgi:uncharacterized protein (DUF362 family)